MPLKIEDFEEYLKNKNVSPGCLDCNCDDEVLKTIAPSMGNWRTLAIYFENDVKAIEHQNSEEEARRYDMLRRWKDENALIATYRELLSNFLKAKNAGLAQKVCDELAKRRGSTYGKATPQAAHTTTTTPSGTAPSAQPDHDSGVKIDSAAAQTASLQVSTASDAQIVDDGNGSATVDRFIVYSRNAHNPRDGKKPHGLALTISNQKFDLLQTRKCSPWYEERLKQTLLALGYRVALRQNQSGSEIIQLFDIIQKNKKEEAGDLFIEKGDDSFICFISSHGDWDGEKEIDFIYGKDDRKGEKVYLQKLAYEKLNAEACSCLRGRPKLFFVQACRGEEGGKIASEGGTTVSPVKHLPFESDFLFFYATAPETKAFRYDPEHALADGECVDIQQVVDKKDGYKFGSFYIMEMCEAIDQCGFTLDLKNIVLCVHQSLQANDNYLFTVRGKKVRMCPHLTTSLRGPVFFYDEAEELFKEYLKKCLKKPRKRTSDY